MATERQGWTLKEIAERLNGKLVGPEGHMIDHVVPAGVSDLHALTFAGNDEYLSKVLAGSIGVVLVPRKSMPDGVPYIQVDNPRASFGEVLSWMVKPIAISVGIHPSAVVAATATVDPTACIGPFVLVGENASIGARTVVHAHGYVGDDCRIGADGLLYPRVTLVQDVHVGDRAVIHSGAVLGADGFGFEWDGAKRVKIPQLGGVRIGNDVEIGANACVDRATLDNTIIEDGVKIDNLVQVGHNALVGEHSVVAGMVGIGGSSKVGKRNMIGAGAGISDHVSTCDDVGLGGRTTVHTAITAEGDYFGSPAQPIKDGLRTFLMIPKLPEIWKRLRDLERKAGGSGDGSE